MGRYQQSHPLGKAAPRCLPVHEGQATGAALAHTVVEIGGGHQARTTVDDPEHGPRLSHLGVGTSHSWGSWVPGTLHKPPSAWTEPQTNKKLSAAPGTQCPVPPQVGSRGPQEKQTP